jgi:GntR family transcriptional regulator of vanillate catabolism
MAGKNSRVIVRIREMILQGELAPGQRVREVELASKLGVSRTPVRESLPILAQEGVLTHLDTRGFVVRAFTSAACSKASRRACWLNRDRRAD